MLVTHDRMSTPASPMLDERLLESDFARTLEELLPFLTTAGMPADDLAAAHKRAAAMGRAGQGEADADTLALLTVLGDLIASLSVESDWSCDDLSILIEETAAAAGIPSELAATSMCLRAIHDPRLLELSPPLALAAQLRVFGALAPVSGVSLWTMEPFDRLRCVFFLGEASPTRRMRLVARSVLSGEKDDDESSRGLVLGVPVLRWQRPHAALVVRVRRDTRELAQTLAEDAAGALAPVFEREALLDRNSSRERSLLEASERRLVRLGFDLHDGPIQDIVALASDLRDVRRKLAGGSPGDVMEVLRKLDGLQERFVAVDGELRELAYSLEPSSLIGPPLPILLEREVDSFRAQTDIETTLNVSGDLDVLSASQRMALIRIVQEALSNVREHSAAARVSVLVAMRRNHVYAEIEDDGQGFVVGRTLVRAATKGRLGLVGMSERTRLLGGRFDVASRPGGPTVVSVVFPPWRPLALENDSLPAAAPRELG